GIVPPEISTASGSGRFFLGRENIFQYYQRAARPKPRKRHCNIMNRFKSSLAVRPRSGPVAVLVAAFSLPSLTFGSGFDWPQWRGPDRTDVSRESGLLKEWPSGGPKQLWLFKNAGNGYSGPAIANGKLFTMGTRDGAEILIALNADTGAELWTASIGPIVNF